jgi:hypothetical protein
MKLAEGREIDFERLLKLRTTVARFGELDVARWWNSNGQMGRLGAAVLRRGFSRTYHFAQARSVFAIAAQRCDESFNPPDCVTLWRLPEALEEAFDARWERWLDQPATGIRSSIVCKTSAAWTWSSFCGHSILYPMLISKPTRDSVGPQKGVLSHCLASLKAQMQTLHCSPLVSRAASQERCRSPMQGDQKHDRALKSERCLIVHNYQGSDDRASVSRVFLRILANSSGHDDKPLTSKSPPNCKKNVLGSYVILTTKE